MRLIDADDLIGELRYLYKQAGWDERDVHFSLTDIEMNIHLLTKNIIVRVKETADVVRCKDCVHLQSTRYPICDGNLAQGTMYTCELGCNALASLDSYCSSGVRRE